MVILSDGDDNNSRYTRDQALEMAQKADAVIYAISTNITRIETDGDKILKYLTAETGGRAFFPFKVEDLEVSFENIASELRHQYNISYRPGAADRRRPVPPHRPARERAARTWWSTPVGATTPRRSSAVIRAAGPDDRAAIAAIQQASPGSGATGTPSGTMSASPRLEGERCWISRHPQDGGRRVRDPESRCCAPVIGGGASPGRSQSAAGSSSREMFFWRSASPIPRRSSSL